MTPFNILDVPGYLFVFFLHLIGFFLVIASMKRDGVPERYTA